MKLLDQRAMQRLFEVTDELGLDREEIEVPLEMRGDGEVERLPSGKLRITLPDADDPGPFLEELPARIARETGAGGDG